MRRGAPLAAWLLVMVPSLLLAQRTPAAAAPAVPEAPAPQQAAPMVGITSFTPAIGADPVLEEKVKAVSAKLRCPVCQGLSLQDSPSELAQQMRAVVREQLAAGRTPNDVEQYFVEKYGEWILLAPTAAGFNSLVYVLPALLIVVGGAGIWFAVRKWTSPTTPVEDAPVPFPSTGPP